MTHLVINGTLRETCYRENGWEAPLRTASTLAAGLGLPEDRS